MFTVSWGEGAGGSLRYLDFKIEEGALGRGDVVRLAPSGILHDVQGSFPCGDPSLLAAVRQVTQAPERERPAATRKCIEHVARFWESSSRQAHEYAAALRPVANEVSSLRQTLDAASPPRARDVAEHVERLIGHIDAFCDRIESALPPGMEPVAAFLREGWGRSAGPSI